VHSRFSLRETASFSFALPFRLFLESQWSDPSGTVPLHSESPSSVHPMSNTFPSNSLCTSYLCSRFPSLVSFLSVSRCIRSKLIGSAADRDALACSWIRISAPWYQVVVPDGFTWEGSIIQKDNVVMGWAYLRRCIDSGPMRNRERIWGISEQLEKKANRMCI
jgi:hypothetical protein